MIDIIKYNDGMAAQLEEAVASAGEFVRKDILNVIKEYPGNATLALVDKKPAAIAAHTARRGDKRGSFTLFVAPGERRGGVGKALSDRVFNEMRGLGIKTVYTDFEPDSKGRLNHFALKLGMLPTFRSHLMRYTGGRLDCSLPIEPYSDDMYERFSFVLSCAFYDLRKGLQLKPHMIEPSDREREMMKFNARHYYVLKENGRIIGVGSATGGMLDDIAVDKAHRGRGIGRALTAYGVNQSIDEGLNSVLLWVVETNREARGLYESIGFTTMRVHQFCTAQL